LLLFLWLSLMWTCHLWYCCNLFNCETTCGTAFTTVGTPNCSILPLVIFCALKFVLSCSLFTLNPHSTTFYSIFYTQKGIPLNYIKKKFHF
jgi:hypothetical protein